VDQDYLDHYIIQSSVLNSDKWFKKYPTKNPPNQDNISETSTEGSDEEELADPRQYQRKPVPMRAAGTNAPWWQARNPKVIMSTSPDSCFCLGICS